MSLNLKSCISFQCLINLMELKCNYILTHVYLYSAGACNYKVSCANVPKLNNNNMFIYTQSGVYGKDPEMRQSHGRTNKLTGSHSNNNNSNNHNEQMNIPFCNTGTAFNYCTNVGVIGSPWSLSNIPDLRSFAKSSPSKTNTPRAVLCSPKYAAVPLTEPPLQFFDQTSVYVQRKGGVTTARRNNNGLIYQQLHQHTDYYSASNGLRQYAHSKRVPASQPVPRNDDGLKRQMKSDRDHCEYVDEGSEYSMHRRDPITQNSWSTVM